MYRLFFHYPKQRGWFIYSVKMQRQKIDTGKGNFETCFLSFVCCSNIFFSLQNLLRGRVEWISVCFLDFNQISVKYPHRVRCDGVELLVLERTMVQYSRPFRQYNQMSVRCSVRLFPFSSELFLLLLSCIYHKGSCSLSFYHINDSNYWIFCKLSSIFFGGGIKRTDGTNTFFLLCMLHKIWMNEKLKIIILVHFDRLTYAIKISVIFDFVGKWADKICLEVGVINLYVASFYVNHD